ncbi:MAG: ankyrin repeat domain-containing protein [Pirellulales bacterium]
MSGERTDENAPDRGNSADDAPKQARRVSAPTDESLPSAIPVPPREAESDPATGRWKVDPTMTPVETHAAASGPATGTPADEPPPHARARGRNRRVRGLLVPLSVCVIGLAAMIVVALVTRQRGGGDAEVSDNENSNEPERTVAPPPPPAADELIAAIRQGEHPRVKNFLDRKADPNAAVGANTPISVAVGRGDTTAVKLLLAAGADANLVVGDGQPPLLAAIERTDAETVSALIAGGADVNGAGWSQTPLVLSTKKGSLPLVTLLLDRQADPNAKTPAGDTPLMLAASYGRDEIADALVEAGADVNAADANGMTPLMYALDLVRPAIVKMLLDKGADPLARRGDGDSPLLIALVKNQWPNYRVLDVAAGEAKPRLPGDSGPIPWKYLSELSPSEPPTAAKSPAAPPTLKKLETPHAIWLAPPEDKKPSHVAYALDRKFRFFQGFVALADSAELKGEQSVTFRIVGDGKELWKSAELSRAGEHRNFRVDVGEVAKLELFVDCKAAAEGAHAIWVEPKLVN